MDITLDKEARLDCCNHIYCAPCIVKKVRTHKEECPKCKMQITHVIIQDVMGRDKKLLISPGNVQFQGCEMCNLVKDKKSKSDYVTCNDCHAI